MTRSSVRTQSLASTSLNELKDEGALLRARVDALETAKADEEQMDVLRRLIGDTGGSPRSPGFPHELARTFPHVSWCFRFQIGARRAEF